MDQLEQDVRIESIHRAQCGLGVVDPFSMSVTPSNSTSRRILISSGTVLRGRTEFELGGTASYEIDEGYAATDRFDLALFDAAHDKTDIIEDLDGADAIPNQCVPLALIEVPKRETRITDDNITDVRALTPYAAINELEDRFNDLIDAIDADAGGGDDG